jgi:hypothetical protein
MTKDQLNDLGVSIAQQCKWDGNAIITAFFEALTDANYHNLRFKLWDTYLDYLDDCGEKL